jgi:hypothetical protein
VHDPQRTPGVGAQLVAQPAAQPAVGVQGVGLPAAAELGEHQLAGQPLVEGVLPQRRGERAEQVGVSAGPQCGVVAVQLRREPLGLQGRADTGEPRRVDAGQRFSAPQL